MPERSEEKSFRVGDEDVDHTQGGQDQPEGGHGEDRGVHDAGDSPQLLSFTEPVGSQSGQWGGNTLTLLTGGLQFSTWSRNKIFHLFKMMETKV